MKLAKFCVDVQTELQKIGSPLIVVAGIETSTQVVPTAPKAVFDASKGGDSWTNEDLGPGQTSSGPAAVCTCYVGITVKVRGISRAAGATRVNHEDMVRELTEDLMVCLERIRKRNRWLMHLGNGAFDVPKEGDQPQQGARYELSFALGVPVVERTKSTVDASQLTQGGTVTAEVLGVTDTVCAA